jgi:CheY-like chemotaxis protein
MLKKRVAANTILFGHDDVEMLRYEEKIYRHFSYKDGRKGMQHLKYSGGKVSLIVSDIMMPEMDGLELTKRVNRY